MGRLQQVYHFLKRNRRAIGLIAGASAAGFAAWRIKRVLDDYKRIIREHDLARLDQHRLQMHMLRSRGECVPALLNFMQTLRKRVYEIVDVTSPVKALKAGRGGLSKQEEQALWHQVKVSGFSRFFLAYYGFNLLNVMLRVQVHILGRYAFEASRQEMLQAAQRDQEEGQGPRGEFCSLGDAGYAATGSSSFGSDDRACGA
ncbi:peroxin-3 [Nannochloropsis gaditana CCMP526]|uniref:peroxin-3 n=1 Tax=Nannochloropsis gaditana (strain CCMP526) TaxID=1093141 RepID=UPI00029F5870|nr:peroxin-3 [Nannochloropsis gaditana CCMP526]EKU20245.1 peroxin-3 [Nannochloropsis gaditana CCMP526]|eukprot:XP_005856109.1 peroxin-3 [Nannochloropsis gaditana CCMP526]